MKSGEVGATKGVAATTALGGCHGQVMMVSGTPVLASLLLYVLMLLLACVS